MPSFKQYQHTLLQDGTTVGKVRKIQSDKIIEQSWNNDIQSRLCYIYDYYHDDQPNLNQGMTYEHTTKTPISAKFIVTQYSSIAKEQVEYHIQFKPSQKITFNQDDELYYFETDYRNKYLSTFPIGLYIDIPDDNNVYHKWLICLKEIANQFVKYAVLPCDYYYHWIEETDMYRIKRKMWGVLRRQLSYNSGLWRDYLTESIENQSKAWLPLNPISEKLYYTNESGDKQNQRLVVSSPIATPTVWQISKVENIQPFGIQKLTMVQDRWNHATDFIDKEEQAKGDLFAMYANYYDTSIPSSEDSLHNNMYFQIQSSSNMIKIGGSYKSLTIHFYDEHNNDITEESLKAVSNIKWSFAIDNQIVDDSILQIKYTDVVNQVKVKMNNIRTLLSKSLDITCDIELSGQQYTTNAQLTIIAI